MPAAMPLAIDLRFVQPPRPGSGAGSGIDSETLDHWRVGFTVRPEVQSKGGPFITIETQAERAAAQSGRRVSPVGGQDETEWMHRS
jgi:hypothetical protein